MEWTKEYLDPSQDTQCIRENKKCPARWGRGRSNHTEGWRTQLASQGLEQYFDFHLNTPPFVCEIRHMKLEADLIYCYLT